MRSFDDRHWGSVSSYFHVLESLEGLGAMKKILEQGCGS
jgi:hypothetical protein